MLIDRVTATPLAAAALLATGPPPRSVNLRITERDFPHGDRARAALLSREEVRELGFAAGVRAAWLHIAPIAALSGFVVGVITDWACR